MPAINLNFAQRSIDRKSGNEEAINAGPKSQRPKRAMPARRPATKQRQLDMTSAIAQSEQSANDRPVYQVFAQRSVPAQEHDREDRAAGCDKSSPTLRDSENRQYDEDPVR